MIPMLEIGMRISHGTTLIELLVVLSILAAMAGLGAAAFGTLEAKRLDRETASTYEWLKAIRQEAMLHGSAYQVFSNGSRLETKPRLTAMNLKQNNNIKIVARSDNPVWQSLCFFPDGSACPGYLELAGAGGKRRLNVDWFGAVTVHPFE